MTLEQEIYKSEDCNKGMKGQDFVAIITYILGLQGQGSTSTPRKNSRFAGISEIMFLSPLVNLLSQTTYITI